MEQELLLPVAPFEETHLFVREGISYIAVRGINKRGMGYAYLEEVELVDGILKARLMPTRTYQEFDDEGALKAIHTYWKRRLVNPTTGKVYIEEVEMEFKTNTPDMIFFSAFLGTPILAAMLNGAVRGPLMGYNDQPIIDGQGLWVSDELYDTNKPADKTAYNNVQPAYIQVNEEVQDTPGA